jgi:hypothetical protein
MPIINRETKIGWNFSIANDESGTIIPCNKPRYANNISKIMKEIDNDMTFQAMREYGFKYIRYWFIEIDGQWKRLTKDSDSPMALLFADKLEVEVKLE